MAELREKQKTRRRQNIIDSVLKLLSVKSYSDISLQDIAELSDVTIPTIYNYFGSKGNILLEVVLSQQSDLSERMSMFAEHTAHRDAARAITAWIGLVTEGAFDSLDRDIWRSIYQARVKDDGLGPFLNKLGEFYVEKSVQFLESLKKRNLISRKVDTKAGAKLLDAICEHYFRLSVFSESPVRSGNEQEINALVKELCRGFAPTNQEPVETEHSEGLL